MPSQSKQSAAVCPTVESVRAEAQAAFDKAATFCENCNWSFAAFEIRLLVRVAALGVCLIRLFLTARRQRLVWSQHTDNGKFRLGDGYAKRTLKTAYGELTYGRQYLQPRGGGGQGFFPLDVELGLSDDRLSPWLMQWVARLATRMSFKAAQMVCKAVLQWAPATETIEQVVLGMGRDAAPFLQQQQPPANDGEVLVIEIDGKCPPTATQAELDKRRGKRKPRHDSACPCGCQRHRGRAKRKARGPKKRRKKGDKSKNGKEVIVVVMYTLKRSGDGKLHGPVNKRRYATFAGSVAAAAWARAEATKRGFGPDSAQTVQVLLDGSKRLYGPMQQQFPKATFTLDVWHVVERLWAVGRLYEREGTTALAQLVDELKSRLYADDVAGLLQHLGQLFEAVARHGPGTARKRTVLQETINYLTPRLKMMSYARWLKEDLVIGSGQVEGTVRHLVGERFDCAGMRWLPGKAEALLHLRCIELNGDWEQFVDWHQRQTRAKLKRDKRRRILSDAALSTRKAA